jgi:hypothetical protein
MYLFHQEADVAVPVTEGVVTAFSCTAGTILSFALLLYCDVM